MEKIGAEASRSIFGPFFAPNGVWKPPGRLWTLLEQLGNEQITDLEGGSSSEMFAQVLFGPKPYV